MNKIISIFLALTLAACGGGGTDQPNQVKDPAFAWCENFVGPITVAQKDQCRDAGYKVN